ncbi:hypothetical protein FQR65_LT13304 [Abscondita terminalis]|nr:hypothetical protein FQR65_LT13304 [Abscondita terminalis]
MGLTSFVLSESRNWKTGYKIIWSFGAACVVAIFIWLNDVVEPFKSDNVLYWFVTMYDLHSDFVYLIATIVTDFLYQNELKQLLIDSGKLDKVLNVLGAKPNAVLVKRYYQLYLLIQALGNTVAHFTADTTVSNKKIRFFTITNTLHWFVDMYKISVDAALQAWIISTTIKLRSINRCPLKTVTDMELVQRVHQKTCVIFIKLSKIYSLPTVISLGMDYFVVTLQTYKLFILIIDKNFHSMNILNVLSFLLWSGLSIGSLIGVCALAVKTEMAMKKRLFNLSLVEDYSLRHKMRAMAMQMLHFKVEFRTAKFFVVDVPLLFHMGSAASVYIFILLQFYYFYV